MADKAIFKLDKREIIGKRVRHLRASGVVPGTVYGSDQEPINVQADVQKAEQLLAKVGLNAPMQIDIDGKKHLAIIKKINKDPVKNALRHIEFQAVSASDPIDSEITIRLTHQGESPAERSGLIVMQVIDTIEVRALPKNMIQHIELSVEKLAEKGDRLTVSDLQLPTGVEFTDKEQDMELAIANVYDPAELEAANEAAGGDATDESEVVSEKGGETEPEAESEKNPADK